MKYLKLLLLIVVGTFSFIEWGASQNVETRNHVRIHTVRTGSNVNQFGTSLLNRKSVSSTEFFIGAPGYTSNAASSGNIKEGAVYKCSVPDNAVGDEQCTDASRIPGIGENGALGMTMTMTSARDSVVMCSPQYMFSCPNAAVSQRQIGSCVKYDTSSTLITKLDSPCPTVCPQGSSLIVDIIILLDGSTSVFPSNFELGKSWIKNLLQSFSSDIDKHNVVVGLYSFSNIIKREIPLSARTYTTLSGMIDAVRYPYGQTFIHTAINEAVREYQRAGRTSVPKLLIVITDGEATITSAVAPSANAARAAGIILTAVGIGSSVRENELTTIAGAAERVFRVSDFSSLGSILTPLQKVITDSGSSSIEGSGTNTTTELTQCQLGLAAHVSKKSNLYVGAVGSYDRAGTVFDFVGSSAFPTSFTGSISIDELKTTFEPETIQSFKDSYMGYSVTSGNFFGTSSTEYIATGVPKYHSKGTVVLSKSNTPITSQSQVHSVHPYGALWQLGSYFGQSVRGIDLNKDSYDDLIVSAPLYNEANGYDQGRVFIFMNNPQTPVLNWLNETYQPAMLSGTKASGARFGMSISSAGDLDQNGYNDIIIGAPYEESTSTSSGVVYVYYNSQLGLNEINRQRISGKTLKSSIQQFGYSVLGGTAIPVDIDNNHYPDVVVGAPRSDSVFLLKSRPIVDVQASIELIPAVLDVINCLAGVTACSTVKICIKAEFRREHAPANLAMDLSTVLDSKIVDFQPKRITIFGKTTSVETKTLSLTSTYTCFVYSVKLNTNALGTSAGALEISPTISFSYDFTAAHQQAILSGIIDPLKEKKISADWTFNKSCSGTNGKCVHDLSVSAAYSISTGNSVLVLGANPGILSVGVTIRNNGPDNAFFTRLNITSGALAFSKTTGSCVRTVSSDVVSGVLVLSYQRTASVLGDMMLANTMCQFTVEYSLDSLTSKATSKQLQLNGIIYSNAGGAAVALDPNLQNNKFELKRTVQYSSAVSVSGQSNPDYLFYERSTEPKVAYTLTDAVLGGNRTNIVHTHMVENGGPLRVAKLLTTFTWPEATKAGIPLLYIYDIQCLPASKCTCDTTNKINSLGLHVNISRATPIDLTFPEATTILPSIVNCADVICKSISCSISQLEPFKAVTLTASFKLWLPSLNNKLLVTNLRSLLNVNVKNEPIYPNANLLSTVSTTVSVKLPVSTGSGNNGVNLGAIIGGILGGIALLCIMIAVMWKVGFFNSKYGEMKRDAMRTSLRDANGDLGRSTDDLVDSPYELAMN
ncbi:integrin alpha-2-like [Ciona intestinalis]